jgi:ABC-type Fe3+/spermidine/putrescine transport system ATPase subunit
MPQHSIWLVEDEEPVAGQPPHRSEIGTKDRTCRARERKWWAGRIRALQQSGTTLLSTTHCMEEAEQLCDQIAIMDDGRIIAMGTLDNLSPRPLKRP